MEKYVKNLAELQADVATETKRANQASIQMDEEIKILEKELVELREERTTARLPYILVIDELKESIESLSTQIIDEWSGEHKTIIFGDRVLKFTQRGSLKIHDEAWLMSDILERISVEDMFKKKYLKGFNLTTVKKYMSVHDLPIDVAEIEYKTTVKLEQRE